MQGPLADTNIDKTWSNYGLTAAPVLCSCLPTGQPGHRLRQRGPCLLSRGRALSCTWTSHSHFRVPGHFVYVSSFWIACKFLEPSSMPGSLSVLYNWLLDESSIGFFTDYTRTTGSLMEYREEYLWVYMEREMQKIKPVVLLLLCSEQGVHLLILPLACPPCLICSSVPSLGSPSPPALTGGC